MKLGITGAANFVRRMYEACGNFQWARELLKNAQEANATRIEFGIEWQAVSSLGHYRRMTADDGEGMTREELLRYFSTLGAGSKTIRGVHDNFGVGARIATLPWNPEGLVVITRKNGETHMIWIQLDEDTADYELVEFEDEDGNLSCVIDPADWEGDGEVDWGKVMPDWIGEHGTVVVLLGSYSHPDTILGNPDTEEADIKGLSSYLNSRFWDLTDIEVRVLELRSQKKTSWPRSPDDKDDERRPNNRRVHGARYWLEDVKASDGSLKASDISSVADGRVNVEWYLWEGDRPKIHSYANKNGYVAIRYGGELFHLDTGKVRFRSFGVIESEVQKRLTIILEPPLFVTGNGRWGVHPDQSRNRLIFTGGGEKGVNPPMGEWALEFSTDLPEPIMEAIREARGNSSSDEMDPEYRKRLADKFSNRWTVPVLIESKRGKAGHELTDTLVDASDGGGGTDPDPFPNPPSPNPDPRRRTRRTRKLKKSKGPLKGRNIGDGPQDVPKIRMGRADMFQKPWHIAQWVPRDPEGPTVIMNVESPILQEVVEYHQAKYPEHFAERVGDIVRQVFGEVACCKVAHSQKLIKEVPEETLDRDYRSEEALTVAVMGLMAEETVIGQRLSKLGRKTDG